MHTQPKKSLAKRLGSNKLVLGVTALIASAMIGTAGVAAAHSNNNNNHNHPGAGYNGQNIRLDLDIRGNNNVVQIIINFFRPN
jgi:hypothetical protein